MSNNETLPAIYPILCEEDESLGFLDFVHLFVEAVPAKRERFQNCLRDNDLAGISELAHQLKGCAGSYGFAALTELARQLEFACKSGHQPLVKKLVMDIDHYMARIATA